MCRKDRSLDLTFPDLGNVSSRDYDLLRIGSLVTLLAVADDPELKPTEPLLPILRRAFEGELAWRSARIAANGSSTEPGSGMPEMRTQGVDAFV